MQINAKNKEYIYYTHITTLTLLTLLTFLISGRYFLLYLIDTLLQYSCISPTYVKTTSPYQGHSYSQVQSVPVLAAWNIPSSPSQMD